MDFPGQPRNPVTGQVWNPSLETYPGGPHPGAIVRMHEEEAGARRDAQAGAITQAEIERARDKRHLLLLR